MANVWSRALCSPILVAVVCGTAFACSERDAATSSDPRTIKKPVVTRDAAPAANRQADDPPPPATNNPATRDAGPAASIEPVVPSGEFHLDGADIEYDAARRDSRPRKSRSIELILRSTPPGAIAAVDGMAVGPTPAVWQGSTDGRAREFTFVLPGYAIARYRFIPMHSGVVHGTLGRLKAEADAGPIEQDSP